MITMKIVLVIIFLMGMIPVVTSDPCFNAFSTVQNDTSMTHHTFRKESAYSVYDCAAQCLMSQVCKSFNYNNYRHICHLNDDNTAVADIVPTQGFLYSDISPWPQSLSGPCAVISCPANNRCQVDRLHRATCVHEFQGCGQPAEMTSSQKEFDGHFLSAEVTYTCDSLSIQCHNRTTSVCQSTENWEDVTGLCGQYKWISPAAGTDYYIPCGPSDDFHVNITGTPSQNTRVSLDVARGNDLPIHADFRLNVNGYTDVTAINSRKDGVFYSVPEVTLNTNPLVHGQTFIMEISYRNGEYKIVVDGTQLTSITNRYPGLVPELVRIYADVSVQNVEYRV